MGGRGWPAGQPRIQGPDFENCKIIRACSSFLAAMPGHPIPSQKLHRGGRGWPAGQPRIQRPDFENCKLLRACCSYLAAMPGHPFVVEVAVSGLDFRLGAPSRSACRRAGTAHLRSDHSRPSPHRLGQGSWHPNFKKARTGRCEFHQLPKILDIPTQVTTRSQADIRTILRRRSLPASLNESRMKISEEHCSAPIPPICSMN
jgi:hypothetical protein